MLRYISDCVVACTHFVMHFFEHPAKQYQLRKYFKNSDDVFVRPQRVSMTGEEEDKFLSQSGLPGFFQHYSECQCIDVYRYVLLKHVVEQWLRQKWVVGSSALARRPVKCQRQP